jgi:hypothetical protein
LTVRPAARCNANASLRAAALPTLALIRTPPGVRLVPRPAF